MEWIYEILRIILKLFRKSMNKNREKITVRKYKLFTFSRENKYDTIISETITNNCHLVKS